MKLIRIGVDLAKNVFQVHGVDRFEKPVWRKKRGRKDWLPAVLELIEPDCEIGMEACSVAHHWAPLQKKGYIVKLIAQTDPVAKRLQQLGGVGRIIARAIVANVGNARQFANGRPMVASIGLTPRQNSSSGKERLLGISKRGDAYLRALLIHGARSMNRTAKAKEGHLSQWVMRIAVIRHPNIAAVALANKTARIACSTMTKETDYRPELVAA